MVWDNGGINKDFEFINTVIEMGQPKENSSEK